MDDEMCVKKSVYNNNAVKASIVHLQVIFSAEKGNSKQNSKNQSCPSPIQSALLNNWIILNRFRKKVKPSSILCSNPLFHTQIICKGK